MSDIWTLSAFNNNYSNWFDIPLFSKWVKKLSLVLFWLLLFNMEDWFWIDCFLETLFSSDTKNCNVLQDTNISFY